ncbi:MAG: hypothetical protein HYY84_19100 [Deltaproteobacteria bacterium]|nr:hypothetical protein [Deltaproteobacteria bacterium]
MGSSRVLALDGIVSVDAVGWFTCAMVDGGAPYCWGNNPNGILGDGTWLSLRSNPVRVMMPVPFFQ